MQWFAFRAFLTGARPSSGPTKYEIVNAGDVSFPDAWPGAEVVASTDCKTWHRVRATGSQFSLHKTTIMR